MNSRGLGNVVVHLPLLDTKTREEEPERCTSYWSRKHKILDLDSCLFRRQISYYIILGVLHTQNEEDLIQVGWSQSNLPSIRFF